MNIVVWILVGLTAARVMQVMLSDRRQPVAVAGPAAGDAQHGGAGEDTEHDET